MRMQCEKAFVARSEGSGSDEDGDEGDEAKWKGGRGGDGVDVGGGEWRWQWRWRYRMGFSGSKRVHTNLEGKTEDTFLSQKTSTLYTYKPYRRNL
jgi:hypothetical protein